MTGSPRSSARTSESGAAGAQPRLPSSPRPLPPGEGPAGGAGSPTLQSLGLSADLPIPETPPCHLISIKSQESKGNRCEQPKTLPSGNSKAVGTWGQNTSIYHTTHVPPSSNHQNCSLYSTINSKRPPNLPLRTNRLFNATLVCERPEAGRRPGQPCGCRVRSRGSMGGWPMVVGHGPRAE